MTVIYSWGIGEERILEMCKVILWTEAANKPKAVSLSNDTGSRRIDNSQVTVGHSYLIDCVPVSNFLFGWTNQQTLPVCTVDCFGLVSMGREHFGELSVLQRSAWENNGKETIQTTGCFHDCAGKNERPLVWMVQQQ